MESSDKLLIETFLNKLQNIKLYSRASILLNNYLIRTSNPFIKDLLKSYLSEDNYYHSMSIEEYKHMVNKINKLSYQDDGDKIMEEIKKKTSRDSQIRSLERILRKKPIKPDIIPLSKIKYQEPVNELVTKYCPHCGHHKTDMSDQKYVICGYDTKGFDWNGCGFDWCFDCGKKLCKCWNVNNLYNIKNRYHNDKCCKSHALKTGSSYKDDYCQCHTQFVNRYGRRKRE